MKRRFGLIALVCILAVSMFSWSALAADAIDYECGSDATWSYENHVLTISGTGRTYNYNGSSEHPWKNYSKDITSVVVCPGITTIGARLFEYMENVESISIPKSVTAIRSHAFYKCASLTEIVIPEGVTEIEDLVFSYSGIKTLYLPLSLTKIDIFAFPFMSKFTTLHYAGTSAQWEQLYSDTYGYLKDVDIIYNSPAEGSAPSASTETVEWTFDGDVKVMFPTSVYKYNHEGNVYYLDEQSDLIMSVYSADDCTTYDELLSYVQGQYGPMDYIEFTTDNGIKMILTLEGNSDRYTATYFFIANRRLVYFIFVYNTEKAETISTDIIDSTRVIPIEGTADGWVERDGAWMYFSQGVPQTNVWLQDGDWFYLDESGCIVKGWKEIGNTWYYFNGSGAMVTGWQQIAGTWYFFNSSGAMITGWQQIAGTWYFFNSSGAMVTGWQQIAGTWYFFNSSGAMATGWENISGNYYYFKSSGEMVTGWAKVSGSYYYFRSSGEMVTGWENVSGTWYYFKGSGEMATGWIEAQGKYYWFDNDGAMATGWKEIDGQWEMFTDDGEWLYTWDGK